VTGIGVHYTPAEFAAWFAAWFARDCVEIALMVYVSWTRPAVTGRCWPRVRAFGDELIERLFALNEQRHKEEMRRI
jgi:hypothetical protein